MNAYEARLIDRIALKEAIGRRLNAQQRHVLCKRLQGYTFHEIARDHRLSRARVQQIERSAVGLLIAPKLGLRDRVPIFSVPAARASKLPQTFDCQAFLKHMQGLIEQRARQRAEMARIAWENEVDILRGIVEQDRARREARALADQARREREAQAEACRKALEAAQRQIVDPICSIVAMQTDVIGPVAMIRRTLFTFAQRLALEADGWRRGVRIVWTDP